MSARKPSSATESMLSAAQQGQDNPEAEKYPVTQHTEEDGQVRVTTHNVDERAEQDYPVENGAVRWDDAANDGDTSREKQAVYDTPWGRRELSATEVTDFAAQGVAVTPVDDEPSTSLAAERDELRKISLNQK